MTNTTELIAAFETAAVIRADLVLFERDEPCAPEALRRWAAISGRSVIERDIGNGYVVLAVPTIALREIEVFLRQV